MSTIDRLRELGQSAWLDFLDRKLIASGELERMIERDGLRGLTSNPTIFQKAIASSGTYDDVVGGAQPSESDAAVLERIMVRDISAACDRFRPLYDRTNGADGFVSIEVSPLAARNTERSIEEAHRLWDDVARPNVLVKIPGTEAGIPAIRQCLEDGLNVNITLLFAVERYEAVAKAYVDALEARLAKGRKIDRVASVASFFVSRVDTKIDKHLDALTGMPAVWGKSLRGQIATANAKIAYERYEELVASKRFEALAAKGARPQRLLWASTSPKDPAYPDVYYVDALVGRDTVDTMTPDGFRGYLDHGHPELRLTEDRELAHAQIDGLSVLGIDLRTALRELEDEGVASFSESFYRTLETIAERRRQLSAA